MINDIQITDNFNLREFQDRRTLEVKVEPKLIYMLQELRNIVQVPVIINSAYRSWASHVDIYKNIYGIEWEEHITKKSFHLKGMAVDIRIPADYTVEETIDLAREIGFKGIGRASNFVHLDVRTNFRMWDY